MRSNKTPGYISEIKEIISNARQGAFSAVNFFMVRAYWLTGRRIVVEEQNGKERADYGKQLINNVSRELSKEYGKGYSVSNIKYFRQFYNTFPDVENSIGHSVSGELKDSAISDPANSHALSDLSMLQRWFSLQTLFETELYQVLFSRLSWTHIRHLLRVADPNAREWYIKEAAANHWATRTLDRNISTQYYQRILSSHMKQPVIEEMKEKTSVFQNDNLDFIKNPTVLEFLNLPTNMGYTEKKLEQALINNLQQFLLELGKGYAFVERQQLVRTETSDFYIDLVFYNYILKCFVIIELKTEKMTHQDIGQLDMYVRMYDDLKRNEGDNPTVGILLCTETDKTIARYSVLNENKQLFATKYLPYLPSEEELAAEIEREKELIRIQLEAEDEE